MRPVARDVLTYRGLSVWLCVSLLVTTVNPAKAEELIDRSMCRLKCELLTRMGIRNHLINGVDIGATW